MKQSVIKITATLLIPYDPDKWGDTHRAEQIASGLMKTVQDAEGVTLDRWGVKKCRVDAE